jgi:hypothetical protein
VSLTSAELTGNVARGGRGGSSAFETSPLAIHLDPERDDGGAGGGARGGAISAVGGRLVLDESTLGQNQALGGEGGHLGEGANYLGTGGAGGAAWGGAIFTTAPLDLDGVQFKQNLAEGGRSPTLGLAANPFPGRTATEEDGTYRAADRVVIARFSAVAAAHVARLYSDLTGEGTADGRLTV